MDAHGPRCWICGRGIGAARAEALAFPASICGECNNTATQPFDEAWRRLSTYLHAHWRNIIARGRFDLSATFADEVEAAAVRVHLYFVKLLGCKLLAEGIAVDLQSFAAALLERRPHPEVTLLVANGSAPVGQIISYNSEVSVLRQGDEVYSAMWMYLAHPVAVKVCYLKAGTPVREPEGFPWHPARQRKIVKLSPYKGDTRPVVTRRDLRM